MSQTDKEQLKQALSVMEREEPREEDKSIKQRQDAKIKPIKKKQKNMQITHYFNKVDKSFPVNKNIPTPDKTAIENIDNQLLALQQIEHQQLIDLQQIAIRRDHLKNENEGIMQTIKQQTIFQLRKISEVDRFFRAEIKNRITQQQIEIKETQQKISQVSAIISTTEDTIPASQLYFIKKQLKQQRKKLQGQIQVLSRQQQRHTLFEQQENSILGRQRWPLIGKRYLGVQLIGKGGFSEVYKGYDVQVGRWIALKLSSVEQLLSGCGDKYSYLKHIKRQYKIHSELSHKNIVQLIEVIDLQNMLCIVLEHCQGPTLAQIISRQRFIPERQAKMIVRQISQVIFYLSSNRPPVIHYDLKPQNIIFHKGQLKVLDFGISKILDNEHSKMSLTSGGVGTYFYLPPETLLSTNPTLSNKVDVWSLGIIFYELIFGRRPFEGQEAINLFTEIVFPEQIELSSTGKKFIKDCLEPTQSNRLSPYAALSHLYFTQ